jgi:hypothetical protein
MQAFDAPCLELLAFVGYKIIKEIDDKLRVLVAYGSSYRITHAFEGSAALTVTPLGIVRVPSEWEA